MTWSPNKYLFGMTIYNVKTGDNDLTDTVDNEREDK